MGILPESVLLLVDNGGGRWAKCIGILDKKRVANVGDRIVVSIQQAALASNVTKLKKGEVHQAVVVQTRKGVTRKDGTQLRASNNCAVLLKKDSFEPSGNRVRGMIFLELRKRFMKILSLATKVI